MKTILFRLDVSDKVGYGHFFRCLSLAKLLKKKFKIVFVFNNLNRNLKNFLTKNNFQFFLNKTYSENLNFEKVQSNKIQVRDATETLKVIDKTLSKIVIIDDYKKDIKWERIIKNSNCKIIVVDDLANRRHSCEILCDSNILSGYRRRYKNKVSKKSKLLLGEKFIILREEFRKKRKKKKIKKQVKKIHFCLNSFPNEKLIRVILVALNDISIVYKKIKLEIFLLNKNDKIINLIKSIKLNFSYRIYLNKNDISKNINNSDLGIGFAGTSMYERASLGLPSITFSNSKNQDLSLYDNMSKKFIFPVKNKNINKKFIFSILEDLIKNYKLRSKLSKFGQKKVDGTGVKRIFNEIIKL